jgi:hypothetical protein
MYIKNTVDQAPATADFLALSKASTSSVPTNEANIMYENTIR